MDKMQENWKTGFIQKCAEYDIPFDTAFRMMKYAAKFGVQGQPNPTLKQPFVPHPQQRPSPYAAPPPQPMPAPASRPTSPRVQQPSGFRNRNEMRTDMAGMRYNENDPRIQRMMGAGTGPNEVSPQYDDGNMDGNGGIDSMLSRSDYDQISRINGGGLQPKPAQQPQRPAATSTKTRVGNRVKTRVRGVPAQRQPQPPPVAGGKPTQPLSSSSSASSPVYRGWTNKPGQMSASDYDLKRITPDMSRPRTDGTTYNQPRGWNPMMGR